MMTINGKKKTPTISNFLGKHRKTLPEYYRLCDSRYPCCW